MASGEKYIVLEQLLKDSQVSSATYPAISRKLSSKFNDLGRITKEAFGIQFNFKIQLL